MIALNHCIALAKLGDTQKAEQSYEMAISLSSNTDEEQYLQARLNLLHAKPD